MRRKPQPTVKMLLRRWTWSNVVVSAVGGAVLGVAVVEMVLVWRGIEEMARVKSEMGRGGDEEDVLPDPRDGAAWKDGKRLW